MNETVKKYLRVSSTLALIAGGSALIIGLTNAVTAGKIEENHIKAENAGLVQVYSNISDKSPTVKIEEDNPYKYIVKIWDAKEKDSEKNIGLIYKAFGRNAYGTITLMLGVSGDASNPELSQLILLEDGQSFKDPLETNYVKPFNDKENKTIEDLDDTKCGATYGADLIKDMSNEIVNDYKARFNTSEGGNK